MIVGNIANHELKLGFESDFNEVIIFTRDKIQKIAKAKKSDIAASILQAVSVEYSLKIKVVNNDVR